MRFNRQWRLGIVVCSLLVPLSTPALAQTVGPLKIKPLPPRPPRAEPRSESRRESPSRPVDPDSADPERPVLKRADRSATVTGEDGVSPCPSGYIAVPTRVSDDEERPPRLSRGGPSADGKQDEPEPEAEAYECIFSEVTADAGGRAIDERGAAPGSDSFIESVRLKAFEFSETLPDFICEQLTSRSVSKSQPPRWKLRDRIAANVIYVDGKERYEDIRRNGKPMKLSPEESGTWSTGEFATLLIDVFHPATAAKFNFVRTSEVAGDETQVYDYSVAKANSHWRITFGGQEILPAYKGSVWIDSESLRVVRIEMAAVNVPPDYPVDNLEAVVDYGPVRIDGRQYVLPTRSENLSCQRNTRNCSRNVIEFRNYRKFQVESTISTTDSSVTFEGEPQLAEPPPQKQP